MFYVQWKLSRNDDVKSVAGHLWLAAGPDCLTALEVTRVQILHRLSVGLVPITLTDTKHEGCQPIIRTRAQNRQQFSAACSRHSWWVPDWE